MFARLVIGAAFAFVPVAAAAQSLAEQDSFRIGSGASVLCTAESSAVDRALIDMFDRGYAIVQDRGGHVVRAAGDAPAGSILRVTLAEGAIAAVSEGERADAPSEAARDGAVGGAE